MAEIPIIAIGVVINFRLILTFSMLLVVFIKEFSINGQIARITTSHANA
jgi:hypothetical protein